MPESNPYQTEENEKKDFLTENIEKIISKWKEISFVLIAFIVVAGIYSSVLSSKEKKEKKAWKEVAKAALGTDAKGDLGKVVKDYPKSNAANYARIQLIKRHFDDKEITKARLIATDFLKNDPDSIFAPQVRVEYAKLLEWEGKWSAARDEYEKVIKANNAPYIMPEALVGKARCLEQENLRDKAKEAYEKAIETFEKDRAVASVARELFMEAKLGIMRLSPAGKIVDTTVKEKKDAVKTAVEEASKKIKAKTSGTKKDKK
jgi:predicted negative regulator of RcsB-dependent stress response